MLEGAKVNMKRMVPKPEHEAARQEMITVLRKYNLEPMEMLALASHFVGQLIALQDQTKITADMALELVMCNLEEGNANLIGDLMKPKGQS